MKNMRLFTVLLAVVLIFSLSACGGKGTSADTSAVSSADKQARADKLAEEAEKIPEPDTVQDQSAGTGESTSTSSSSSTTTTTTADVAAPSAANPDKLLGDWVDVTNVDRFAKITKDGDKYTYQDNDSTYPGTVKDGVLIIQISSDPNDTAQVFIDSSTGNLVTNYQGDLYEFSKKVN